MRVLITVPNLNELGGVANYYRALDGRFRNQVDYLKIGGWQGVSSKTKLHLFVIFLSDIIKIAWRARNYDLIHFNPSLSARCFVREMILLSLVKLSGAKAVIFFRGWNPRFADLISHRFRWLFRIGYARADAFIVLADEFKKKILDWGYRGAVYVESTIVDERHITPSQTRRTKDSTHGPLHGLYLGRLERAKGVFQCVEALSYLCDSSVRLSLAGDGNARDELKEFISTRGLKNVELLGWLSGEAKSEAFRHSDFFVYPTTHAEGMPTTVLEAMAYGLPVICSAVGGTRDFFNDGEMGYLVDPSNISDLVVCIQRLIDQPARRAAISNNNRWFAREFFYSEKVLERLERIYAEVQNNTAKGNSWYMQTLTHQVGFESS